MPFMVTGNCRRCRSGRQPAGSRSERTGGMIERGGLTDSRSAGGLLIRISLWLMRSGISWITKRWVRRADSPPRMSGFPRFWTPSAGRMRLEHARRCAGGAVRSSVFPTGGDGECQSTGGASCTSLNRRSCLPERMRNTSPYGANIRPCSKSSIRGAARCCPVWCIMTSGSIWTSALSPKSSIGCFAPKDGHNDRSHRRH